MNKPLLIFDGECGFCRRRVERWKKITGPVLDYEPYQAVLPQYPQLSESDCRRAVQLVLPDGKEYSGAEAVFRSLALGGRKGWLWWYEHVPLFAPLSEAGYRLIARSRHFLAHFM